MSRIGPVFALALVLSGCGSVLGIPGEGQVGCPSPCTVSVSGKTVSARSTSNPQTPLSNVKVTLKDLAMSVNMTVTSGVDGSYRFDGLPPGTTLKFTMEFPETSPAPPAGFVGTQYTAGVTAMDDMSIDLPVIEYSWLASVATQCGIFATVNDALAAGSYFTVRSTVVGQVLASASGTPAALDLADLSVILTNNMVDFANYSGNADSAAAMGLRVCFLEPNLSLGELQGKVEDRSTSGRFVMFRVRNNLETGAGTGQLAIPSFPPGPINMSAGAAAFARIVLGQGTALPPRPATFERDVFHWFVDKGCSTDCHKPGGAGYNNAPLRSDANGTMYHADWSAPVENAFNNLTLPVSTGCETDAPDTVARVCMPAPMKSLLFVYPTGRMAPNGKTHPGINNLADDDPMMVAVIKWITDGAALR